MRRELDRSIDSERSRVTPFPKCNKTLTALGKPFARCAFEGSIRFKIRSSHARMLAITVEPARAQLISMRESESAEQQRAELDGI